MSSFLSRSRKAFAAASGAGAAAAAFALADGRLTAVEAGAVASAVVVAFLTTWLAPANQAPTKTGGTTP